jgi:dTDP-4-amino-4,6-dideoxygalactose transaminase
MPSFTYVSGANAVALRNATPVFVDIRPDTLNLDETLVEDAITPRTKALLVTHYGGCPCEMDRIRSIAKQHGLLVIEDAAHALGSTYHGQPAGTMGDAGCISFDVGKNIHCFKGGALVVNNEAWWPRAQRIVEKGTNRIEFDQGLVNHYTWTDLGSNIGMSLPHVLLLTQQLRIADEIIKHRRLLWLRYQNRLTDLAAEVGIDIPQIPEGIETNGHIFHLRCRSTEERSGLIRHLAMNGITAVFHFIPLHSSPAGRKYGRFHGDDVVTTCAADRLLRLPLFHELEEGEVDRICSHIIDFYTRLK